MIKTFKDYLADGKKTFSFKVWFANANFATEHLDVIKQCLAQYELEKISALKSMPIREHEFFPGYGPVELQSVEIDLKYPCNATQIYDAIVRSGLKIAGRNVVVINKGIDTSTDDNLENDKLPLTPMKKQALLNTPYEDDDNSDLYGEKYNLPFLKSLTSREYVFAGDKTNEAKTTNDDTMGTSSPVGSTKVKKPSLPKIGRK